MRIDIISAVPELLHSPLNTSILKRAQDQGILELVIHDLHDYGKGKYRHIDDAPYGGGAGMVIGCEAISKVLDKLLAERNYDQVIFMTPDAQVFSQPMANQISSAKSLIFLCGHYKGIDERIRETYVTQEISIGDFVLTGGEIPACAVIDSVVRLIPGVISDEQSALNDSFQDGLLSPPVYTRPAEWNGKKVPEVLLSGDFKKIDEWRQTQAEKRTQTRRPDLLKE
ncbi:MAG: tRNA (guanosine(37)-N1)-methyltransferase TrmD [Crocinitomicaceae bacterium]|nr:tRNA (guanosine(37)-N1)-methyltransferase TrmD [Crocinitomicaceae bacterium]